LHAERLEFLHPRSGKPVLVECPPPADFERLVHSLEPPKPRP
jgi:hypothetical protein